MGTGISILLLAAGGLLAFTVGLGFIDASDAVPFGGLVLAGVLLAWLAATDRLADPPTEPRDS